jgi:archaemetzincin
MIPQLRQAILRLTPLHEPLEKPQPGDWLAQHKEPGQTFDEYLGCSPITPRGRRSVLYVQALGPLTPTQRKIVDLTREYLACYFGVTCREGNDLLDALVPASARRTHPAWGDKQILSTYVLDKVLKPRLPSDAAASIALTASDLWPGEGWNFVFGQASLQDRVGVWSLCRFGDPNESDKAFRLCLRRTLQTASHETGHMFSILHCTAWQCNMCGSNSLPESDHRPTWLCPQCTAKVCWAAGYDPGRRFRNLADFCRKAGLSDEAEFYRKSLEALSPAWPSRFAGRGEDWCCPVKQFPGPSFFTAPEQPTAVSCRPAMRHSPKIFVDMHPLRLYPVLRGLGRPPTHLHKERRYEDCEAGMSRSGRCAGRAGRWSDSGAGLATVARFGPGWQGRVQGP